MIELQMPGRGYIELDYAVCDAIDVLLHPQRLIAALRQ
jgi:hypothetical protein